MYGAAVAAYGVGTFAGNAVAPLLRRRYGEDRLTAGAARRPRRRRRRSAPSARRGRSSCSCRVVLGGGRRRRPPGLRRPGPDPRPGGVARPLVRPLRDPLPARLGGRRDRRRRRRHPDPLQPGRRRRGADPGRRGSTCGPCARPTRPTSRIPFDPVEVARRRIDHAIEWHRRRPRPPRRHRARRRRRPRPGHRDASSTPPSIVRLDALRAAAVSTWPLDTREVDWAMSGPSPSSSGSTAPDRRPADRRRRRARPPTPRAGGPQASPAGSTDDDVTVHCDERRPIVSTTLRPVDVGAVDLDVDVDRVALRRQRADGDQHAVVAHRARRPRPRARLGAVVGEAALGVLVELADDLGLDVGAIVAPRPRRRRRRPAARRGRPAAARSATHVADRGDVDLGVARQLLARPIRRSPPTAAAERPRRPPRPTTSPPARLVGTVSQHLGRFAPAGVTAAPVRRAMICSTGPYGHPSGRSVGRSGRSTTVCALVRRSWISRAPRGPPRMIPASVCRRSTSRCRSALTDCSSLELRARAGRSSSSWPNHVRTGRPNRAAPMAPATTRPRRRAGSPAGGSG